MARAGVTGQPGAIVSSSVRKAKVSACLMIPAGVAAAALVTPLALALGLVPLVVLFLPELTLRDKTAQRREGVEQELPFFSILVNVLSGAGVPLYQVFDGLAESDIFPSLRSEARRLRRDMRVFGSNPVEAFESLAADHPSKKFEAFLLGYASKARAGADLSAYLEGESGSFLRELEESWTRYATRVGVVGSLMITVFGVVPLLLLVVGFFTPATSTTSLTLFALVGVPLVTVMLLFLAGRMLPAGEEAVRGRLDLAALAGLPGALVWYTTGEPWAGAAASLLGSTLVYGASVRGGLREMKETDEGLPGLLKDVLEFKRQDYDLGKALVAVSGGSKYSPSLDMEVEKLAAQLRAGVPLGEATAEAKTRLGKVVFFVLKEMARSGGGSVDTVFQLSKYASKVTEMKRNAQAEMKPYLMLSYATPVLLAFGVAFVGGVLSSLGSGVRFWGGAGSPAGGFESIRGVAYLLIVVSSAALGTVGAKIADFTARNTLRASLGVGVSSATIAILPLLNLTALLHVPA